MASREGGKEGDAKLQVISELFCIRRNLLCKFWTKTNYYTVIDCWEFKTFQYKKRHNVHKPFSGTIVEDISKYVV